jgi:hypothetical protein
MSLIHGNDLYDSRPGKPPFTEIISGKLKKKYIYHITAKENCHIYVCTCALSYKGLWKLTRGQEKV